MKILLITYKYPPDLGGTAVMAQRIATALSNAGHRITVLTTDNGATQRQPSLTFSLVKRRPILYLFALSLRAYLYDRRENFDYILINDLPAAKAVALTFTRRMLRKVVLVIHGSEPENVFVSPSLMTRVTFFRHFYLRLLEQCGSIVAFSCFMREKLLRHVHAASIKKKLRVCRMVNDHGATRTPHGGWPAAAIADPERYVVLTVSRIVAKKGFERMLRIMSSVISQDKRVHWNIVGAGPYETRLRRDIQNRALQANVTLLGAIDDRCQLSRCYQAANVFLLLSEFEEGLGLVYLEAAAHGLPSIANDKSGERESVKPNVSGFLTNTDEEVLEIILQRRAESLRHSPAIYEFASQHDVKLLPECIFNFTIKSS